jgi:hypothetical protein
MMAKPTASHKLIGPYAKPKVRGSGCVFQPGTLALSQNEFLPLDTPAWFAWLQHKLAFRFEQAYYLVGASPTDPFYLSYTVRPERRQRGPVYWYGYKKYHNQRLPGMYLGKTDQVTLDHLDQLALHCLAHIKPLFYRQVCLVGLVRFRTVPPPDPSPKR